VKLRTAREAKGLSIEQLSSITKINPAFLTALENGRWDLLPGRMYLKPFTKTCAEVLDLDINDLYEQIDGVKPEEKVKVEALARPVASPPKSRIDYKLPIVLISVLIVIALIAFAVKTRRIGTTGSARKEFVVPARGYHRRTVVNWQRPWEKPPLNPLNAEAQRLRLEALDDVWACVVSDGDTVFMGDMAAKTGKSFWAGDGFFLSLSRNDRMEAYLNGIKLVAIGNSRRRLDNYPIKAGAGEGTTADEAE
jgi:transcriptional regulator with XRE-family HTH domain